MLSQIHARSKPRLVLAGLLRRLIEPRFALTMIRALIDPLESFAYLNGTTAFWMMRRIGFPAEVPQQLGKL